MIEGRSKAPCPCRPAWWNASNRRSRPSTSSPGIERQIEDLLTRPREPPQLRAVGPLSELPLPGRLLGPTATGDRQGRASPRGAVPSRGLHHHHPDREQPGRRPLLQPARDGGAVDQGRQGSYPQDRLSCHRFRASEVRLQLGVIAYNLGNLLRRLVLPVAIQSWSLTSLQQRLFRTGGRLIRHARHFTLQLAESYLTRPMFRRIVARIERRAWHPT